MKKFHTRNAFKTWLQQEKDKGRSIGFVPTMGALHPGHISLVKNAGRDNDIVVASVFVNPAQFNNSEDLRHYPRKPREDELLLLKAGCAAVFMPSIEEVYPPVEDQTRFSFDPGNLDKVMEGKFRPGHFRGVAMIVHKLLDLIQPERAYFGEKDYQQLLIIKKMVQQKQLAVEIIGCPTIREENGLAMSSRNERLNAELRKEAALIYDSLIEARNSWKQLSVTDVRDRIKGKFSGNRSFELEYIEIADAHTLQPIKEWNEAQMVIACIAVYAGEVRLIDNMILFP